MRRKQSSLETARDAGQQLAVEFRSYFVTSMQGVSAEEQERKCLLKRNAQLREIIYQGVYGFNQNISDPCQLAILDRGDRLIFNSRGEFTLTVDYRQKQIIIHCAQEHDKEHGPSLVDVWTEGESLRFRPVPVISGSPELILDDVQFVQGLIRMACGRSFERKQGC